MAGAESLAGVLGQFLVVSLSLSKSVSLHLQSLNDTDTFWGERLRDSWRGQAFGIFL